MPEVLRIHARIYPDMFEHRYVTSSKDIDTIDRKSSSPMLGTTSSIFTIISDQSSCLITTTNVKSQEEILCHLRGWIFFLGSRATAVRCVFLRLMLLKSCFALFAFGSEARSGPIDRELFRLIFSPLAREPLQFLDLFDELSFT